MMETIPGTRAVAVRLVQAEMSFVALIMDSGYNAADANKIFAVWRREKCCKRQGVDRWTVTHGGFWDKAAMDRALALANEKPERYS